jgi:hypothetical protein
MEQACFYLENEKEGKTRNVPDGKVMTSIPSEKCRKRLLEHMMKPYNRLHVLHILWPTDPRQSWVEQDL